MKADMISLKVTRENTKSDTARHKVVRWVKVEMVFFSPVT